jgi:hypothetical protein
MVLVLLADSEVLDIGSENKVKCLLPNGKLWCLKTHSVDGKLEWIGSFATKEAALCVYYDILNGSSCLGVKEVPPKLLRPPVSEEFHRLCLVHCV